MCRLYYLSEVEAGCKEKKHPKLYTLSDDKGKEVAQLLIGILNVKDDMTGDGTIYSLIKS